MSDADLTVLVVDDYPDAADAVADLLAVSGFRAHAARSSGEALDVAEATKPDVVILEPRMKDGGGWEGAAWPRRKDGTGPMLVALTSARIDRAKYQAAGFDYLVLKGDDPRTLVAAVALAVRSDQ